METQTLGILKNKFFNLTKSFFTSSVESCFVIDLSSGMKIVSLKSGNIDVSVIRSKSALSKEEILANLEKFLKVEKNNCKSAALILPAELFFIKRLKLPQLSENELINAAKWQIKDELPFNESEGIFSYSIIAEERKEDGSKQFELIFVAAEEKKMREYVLLLKHEGLDCNQVIPASFGFSKFFEKYPKYIKETDFAIVNVFGNNSFISIYKAYKLVFFRLLPFSINNLRQDLSSTLVLDKGKVKLTDAEIENIIFQLGVPTENLVTLPEVEPKQVLSLIRPALERLAQEIKRSLLYYETQYASESINKIYLAGDALRINNLDSFLNKELSIDVSDLDILEGIRINSEVLLSSPEVYPALGVSFDRLGVNLIPYEFRTEKIENVQRISLRWVTIIGLILLLLSYFLSVARMSVFQKRLENADFQLNILSEIKDIKIKLDAFDLLSLDIKSKSPAYESLLKAVSSLSPRELYLSSFEINGAVKEGKLSGIIKDLKLNPNIVLTSFVSSLEKTGYFKEINIDKVTRLSQEQEAFLEFEINLKLK